MSTYTDGYGNAVKEMMPLISDMATMLHDYVIKGHINGHLDSGQAKAVVRDARKFLRDNAFLTDGEQQ